MYSGYEETRQKNPRQTSNLLSFLTFGYTISLFRKGFKGNLQESDIYEVPRSCNSKICGDKVDEDWQHCKTSLSLLLKSFGSKYFLYTTIHLTWNLINSTVHPYAMSRFISYFEKNQTHITKSDACYYGGVVICLSIFCTLWIHNYYMLECTLGIQIRTSLTSLIYRKVLRLRPEQVKGSSMGNIVTVLTKDIRTVETTIWPLSDMIIGCVKFVYLAYLLYARIGIPSFLATGLMTFVIVVQALLSRFVLKLRLHVGKMADKRLHFTKEVLSALKIIKMYTWEQFFHNRIREARNKETKTNLKSWYLGTIIIAFGTLFGKLMFPLFLLTYISLGYSTNTELVYYLMGLFREYATVIGVYLPMGFGLTAEFYASIVRIGRILKIKEPNSEENEKCNRLTSKQILPDEVKIDFQNLSVTIEGSTILDNVSFSIAKPGLYMITGALGSGKSSILKVILEEYQASRGQLHVSGILSYASQDPWLFPATVRQNILFGQPFDRERYEKILEICSLEQDLTVLPNGDSTVIIDGGLNLSKGQQARINLARSVYKQSDIYLLDDPLACLDGKVQDEIFRQCIRNFLKEKIVIFLTQNTKHLKHAHKLIILEHGQIRSVLQPDEMFENEIVDYATSRVDAYGDHVPSLEGERDQVKIYHEDKTIGGVDIMNYYRYVKYGGGVLVFAVLIVVFFGAQFTESYAEKLVSKCVLQPVLQENTWQTFGGSDRARAGSRCERVSHLVNTRFLLGYGIDYHQGTLNSSLPSKNQNITTSYGDLVWQRDNTFDLYIIMIIMSSIIDLVKSYWFLVYCRKASIKFHKLMCQSIINCVMTFLDNHFIGNILNRFSYDLDHIDEVFPFLFKDLIICFFSVGGTLVLIVTVDWIFLWFSILFFITLAILRMLYIPTARALKRLGAITRSPFIGHLNATVEGLSTIKAFKEEGLLKNEFDKHQDLAISAAYMETTTARAFGYALDLDGSMFITVIILTFLFINTETSVGNVGLALTQIFVMSESLQRTVRIWALLEQCMTSVERVIEYTEISQENKLGEKSLIKWLKSGKIEYRGVNLVYNFENKVLKNVSFTVNPGEKVGIVGRTGAGKSSIISTLFRLYEYQGRILIDDIDIKDIPLEYLRRSISIIPQDPIVFAGTVRENIDPLGTSLDKDIWKVLKNVRLENSVAHLDENILHLTLTTGQKQLLSLARALLKNNRIVVMDEPTANLDAETDGVVQDLMKRHFNECTLIIVAHRLQSTLDCDKVIVMENGEIVEFDKPHKLLDNKDSLFSQMINI